jgi:uncharacterized protein
MSTARLADATVRDNARELRYELHLDSRLVGEIRYRREPGARVLVHVEIEPHLEGHGFGSLLVEGALDDLRAQGLLVVPHAPFVIEFIRRRPEYADLVTVDPAVPD